MRVSLKLHLATLALLVATLAFATPALAELRLEKFALGAQNADGTLDVQAGSHPYSLTNTFLLHEPGSANGDLKDLTAQLPPGFVGDPNATPRCAYHTFIANRCSNETAIGVSTTYVKKTNGGDVTPTSDPVYNLVPPAGVAAEFGFIVAETTPVLLDTSVRTGTDYGLTSTVSNLPQAVVIAGNKLTIWGVPASPAHDLLRGKCLRSWNEEPRSPEAPGSGLSAREEGLEGPDGPYESEAIVEPTEKSQETGGCATQSPEIPLLSNPTSCNTPRTATFSVDSWQEPGDFLTDEHVSSRTASLPELEGCEKLNFAPTIAVKPDGTAGSTPTGLNVGVSVPQEPTENPVGLAEADVRDTTVTLPTGVQLSPSAADGLQGCSIAQIGYEGFKQLDPASEPGVRTAQFKPKVYDPATGQEEATLCPDASKVANVKIKTPLLEGELEGSVFLAAPQNFTLAGALEENPFRSLFALYLVAEEPKAGVLVKLPGHVELGEPGVANGLAPGQIRTTFENTPQLPFSDLELEFYGTDRAPLATPAYCGTYTTAASLTPWTSPESGAPRTPSSSFDIGSGPEIETSSGPQRTACPGGSLPFSPSLVSDTTNVNAGAFTPLQTTLSREDGQQSIQSVTLHYSPGLSGILTGIPLCGEGEANAGTCSAASQIGETIVSVGLGNDPFSVTGGKVYLTGPYDGAPFGLSIVNPAKAGPFDLQEGRPVVVRATINVDPHTAALTVTTNSASEGHEIPTIIEGIPLQIKHVYVNIDRAGFTFNPTNCDPMKVEGTVNSAEGASAPVSIPFQVTNCEHLKFTPKFSVSTSGKNSKAKGASLTAKLSYPAGSFGTQSEIAKVKVDLPKQLPSRLTTLQKACTDAQFELNPANCPKASKIGYAKVTTPLLPVVGGASLQGPAIFVSHGGEAFPSLTMVLQGYGVTIDLVGTTNISKAGITSTTFKTVPDQPFSTFELTLPEGHYSALAANGSLCGQKLVMPNEFIGQNGAAIHENTTISVTGCSTAISIVSHKIKGRTLIVSVSVPAAGKVTASGKGLSTSTKSAKGRETLTFKLTQKKGGKLKTTVNVTFTPSTGKDRKKQAKSAKVRFEK
jgi:hypothetical protein